MNCALLSLRSLCGYSPRLQPMFVHHRVHRVATVIFWRTFHHDGKISPGWCGEGGARPPAFTKCTITNKVVEYAPAERTDTLPVFLIYPYMYSVVFTTELVCYYVAVIYVKSNIIMITVFLISSPRRAKYTCIVDIKVKKCYPTTPRVTLCTRTYTVCITEPAFVIF